jgi:putative DNA-invertase from lambdoid prophage Rac
VPRTFAYCRVSTAEQTPENQLREISAAGFVVEPKRVVEETASGSVSAGERKGFKLLLQKLEEGDILVVTKLDRLGRNAMALGGADLTSPAGAVVMRVLAAMAQFERDLLIERTQSGLARAKAQGKKLGRPASLTASQCEEVLRRRGRGDSLGILAKAYGVSRAAIQRVEKRGDPGSC